MIVSFSDYDEALGHSAGGKGSSLARLFQSGFPVPDGFVITVESFADEGLADQQWDEVVERFHMLRQGGAVAVRSSALAEDSSGASYAGSLNRSSVLIRNRHSEMLSRLSSRVLPVPESRVTVRTSVPPRTIRLPSLCSAWSMPNSRACSSPLSR